MLGLLCALSLAWAGEWGEPKPYVQPVITGGYISVNGQAHAQVTGGAIGGVRMRYKGDTPLVSHTRAMLTGTYGITGNSLGADARVGSFIGPDTKLFLVQIGPDLYYNGYGQIGAVDYFLPWSAGVDVPTSALVKLSKPVRLLGQVSPGWVFASERRSDQVSPFHELDLLAAALLNTKVLRLTVGMRRTYNGAGVIDSLVLSGAL